MASTLAIKKVADSLPFYKNILSLFPLEELTYCFAYGSGVIKQSGKYSSQPMIDLVFVVNDTVQFHKQNLDMNPHHYSGLKYLGSKLVANVQDNFGAKVYYNTLIPIKDLGVTIKYGVVSQSNLVTDLLDWSELYLAGRLHKPVQDLMPATDPILQKALQQNLYSAVHTALLMLPDVFTEKELFKTLTNLSYSGDFRVIFGEDKNKVNNIVDAQVERFQEIYHPIIDKLYEFIDMQGDASGRICRQDTSPVARLHHLNQLPRTPQRSIVRFWNKQAGGKRQDTEDVLRAVSFDVDVDVIVASSVKNIVWLSSTSQSLKGLFTAGLFKSIIYSGRKILKMILSKKH